MDNGRHCVEILDYPRSYASTTESQINRSRAWCDDIIKHWNVPIKAIETFSERAQRYLIYFEMTPVQLLRISGQLLDDLSLGLKMYEEAPSVFSGNKMPTIKISSACITETMIPTGKEKGLAYSIDFGGKDSSTVYAALVQMEGNGKATVTEISENLIQSASKFSKGCLSASATASTLFDNIANLLKRLRSKQLPSVENKKAYVGFGVGFPINQRGIKQASLIRWTKGYETGRETNDPVEGADLDAFLEHAFCKAKLNAKVGAIVTDSVATLIAAYYEKQMPTAELSVGFSVGSGVRGCFIQSDSQDGRAGTGSIGVLLNCELGCFDSSLPVTDIDVGVDFSDAATGTQIFEKMIATDYLGELCRRLVLKVWQTEAPRLAWTHYSLPWKACAWIIQDKDENNLDITNEVLVTMWDWTTTIEQRRALRELFKAVFKRSAALAAASIVALSAKTGRLQPAMGGVTCAITGLLYQQCPFYRESLESYIRSLLSEDIASCIRLYEPQDAITKGSAILAFLNSQQK